MQPPQDWGNNIDQFNKFVEDIITMLSSPSGIDVLLLQGWPAPTQDCDYCVAALAIAAKQTPPKIPQVYTTLYSPPSAQLLDAIVALSTRPACPVHLRTDFASAWSRAMLRTQCCTTSPT